jgi:ribosomal protein S6--L-glutamate ligase
MRFCFILEERYRGDSMPQVVATDLVDRGHDVQLLEPRATVTCLSALATSGFAEFDAFVLKTVSNGPGLSILEAAGAAGITTVNDWRSIPLVRDKAVALAYARARGLPFPVTWFVTDPALLDAIPRHSYPLVVKPAHGSLCESVVLVKDPSAIADVPFGDGGSQAFLAQRYIENDGYDLKLYNTGVRVYATVRRSCLHPETSVRERVIPVTPRLEEFALRVGEAFGLSIYGVDLVRGPHGWVGVDINDFPSFGLIPGAVPEIGDTIVRAAQVTASMRNGHARPSTAGRPIVLRLPAPEGGESLGRAPA